jgi:hypothetical protein
MDCDIMGPSNAARLGVGRSVGLETRKEKKKTTTTREVKRRALAEATGCNLHPTDSTLRNEADEEEWINYDSKNRHGNKSGVFFFIVRH